MKKLFIPILLGTMIIVFVSFDKKKEKQYLPVRIKLIDSTLFKKDILFNFLLSFSSKKIKFIGNVEANELITSELNRAKNIFKMVANRILENQKDIFPAI